MASCSISDPPLSSKKKRTNGTAKLKQMKLDVRREQWLSRLKKGCNVNSNGNDDYCPSSKIISSEENNSSYKENKRKEDSIEGTHSHGNDSKSMFEIPIRSTYDCDESRNGFIGNSSCSSSSTRSSNTSTCSRNDSDEEEDDDNDGCLDDWEAVADALYANDSEHSIVSESHPKHEMLSSFGILEAAKNSKVELCKKELKSVVPESHLNGRAWKSDDTLRPRCLSKQHRSPINRTGAVTTKLYLGHGKLSFHNLLSVPSVNEDLDVTDSSFLPCSCGFCLCLFCHRKILEADGRCPGCRKLYDNHADGNVGFNIGSKAFYITQSCSMSTGC